MTEELPLKYFKKEYDVMSNITNYSFLFQSMFGGDKDNMGNGSNVTRSVPVFSVEQCIHTVAVKGGRH